MISKEDFHKLQMAQIDIIDEIHRICVANNIEYYIIGGTALGAVRHGGFIPWDLDIDIAMRRPEYDQFKKICMDGQLDSRYLYRDYLNTPNYESPHAHVCIKNTVLLTRNSRYNKNKKDCEIYLDVFPLDVAPADSRLQKKQKEKIIRLRKIKEYKIGRCYASTSSLKRVAKKFVSKSIFWTSIDKINKKMDECMRKYNDCISGYVCSMASHYPYEKQCMESEIYGTPKLVDFNEKQYYAPQQLDAYLRHIYNDYMKIPPLEEQKENLDTFEYVAFNI